jgi:hypothetical protein
MYYSTVEAFESFPNHIISVFQVESNGVKFTPPQDKHVVYFSSHY